MLMAEQQNQLKSLLTASVMLLCKTGLNYKTEFTVEGLLGITVDSTEIILVNIKETISCPSELIAAETANKTCEDLAQGLTMAFLCKDDIVKDNGNANLGETEMELPCSASLSDKNLEENLTQSIVEIAESYVKYEGFDDDEPHSTLLTYVELDELFDKANKTIDLTFESCDQINYDTVLMKKQKLLLSDDSQESRNEADIMFENAKDQIDHITAVCTEWDAITDEMVPLNLAGPQDLSTGISKETYICQSCGKVSRSESRLKYHNCETVDSDESLLLAEMPQPLNLKKQPLDLTIGRVEGDQDIYGDLYLMDDNDGFTCLCSRSYRDYQSYVNHSTTCSKAKLTPYKSCEICGKFLFSNSGYTKHKKLHVGEYKFHCNICHKGFFDQTHLRAHNDSSHSKVRRHACPCCRKSFFWKHHLKRHLRTCDKGKCSTSTAVTQVEEDVELSLSSSDVIGLS